MTQIGTPPDHTVLGERLADRTGQMAPDDPDYGWAHGHLSEALALPLLQFQEAFDPEDAASFETILDPDRCPDWALPWLAQLAGITLPATASTDEQRLIIHGLASHKRGTVAMLEAAAGIYLTGTKTVYFRERDPDSPDPPYTLQVRTITAETPDPAKVLAALMAQKPAGIVLNYNPIQAWDYQALHDQYIGQNYTYLAADFDTYAAMTAHTP